MARLVRFLGSMVALWAVGLLMPWNGLRWMPPSYYLPVILATVLFSLVHALPRPRWHPAAVWALFLVFDVALFYGDMYAESAGWLGIPGYSPAPGPILVNSLVVATAVWLLWWKVPGSRRS